MMENTKSSNKAFDFEAGENQAPLFPAGDPLELVYAIQSYNNSALQQFMKNQASQLDVLKDLSNGQAISLQNLNNDSQISDALSAVHRYIDLSEQFQINSNAAYNAFLSQQKILIQHAMDAIDSSNNISHRKKNLSKGNETFHPASTTEKNALLELYTPRKEKHPHSLASAENEKRTVVPENEQSQNRQADRESRIQDYLPFLISIISTRTGYPEDILNPNMDLEKDLGIDSMEKIDLLLEIRDTVKNLTEKDDKIALSLATIGEMADFMNKKRVAVSDSPLPTDRPAGETDVLNDSTDDASGNRNSPAPESPPSVANVHDIFLKVISETTGYPEELFEQSMNLENDLGIDSIKRVEIFSALSEKLSQDFSQADIEAIAAFSTIGEIVDYLSSKRVQQEKADPSALANQATHRPAAMENRIKRYEVGKKNIQNETADNSFFLNKGLVLITKDDIGLSEKMARIMRAKGLVPVLVALPEHPDRQEAKQMIESGREKDENTIPLYPISVIDEKDIESLFQTLKLRYENIRGFIHISSPTQACWPGNESNTSSFSHLNGLETMKVNAVFLMAKHFYHFAIKDSQRNDHFFACVTRIDGELGLGDDFTGWSVQGSLFGLCKSLQREWGNVVCKAIDIHPECRIEHAAHYLCEELVSSDQTMIEVGRKSDGKRMVLMPKEKKSVGPIGTVSNHVAPSKDDVFLLIGGGRGITSRCAIALAQEFQCKIVLFGRTALQENSLHFADHFQTRQEIKDDYIAKHKNQNIKPAQLEKEINALANQFEIRRTLQAITKAGGQALYFNGDATDATALQSCLNNAQATFGKITGLVHGAGILADKKIQRKTREDFECVFNTKVKTLEASLQYMTPDQLRYLVLFSSTAAFFGNQGQTDYAMANEVLNKIAYQYQKRHPNTFVASINWGPWDSGMVTPTVKKRMQTNGIPLIPSDIGATYFVDELKHHRSSTNQCQILIG